MPGETDLHKTLKKEACRWLYRMGYRCIAAEVRLRPLGIIDAVGWLYRQSGMVVEPSGAATTAAVAASLGAPVGTVAAVVSGGNVQPEQFAAYIAS